MNKTAQSLLIAFTLAMAWLAAEPALARGMDSTDLHFTPVPNSGPKTCPSGQVQTGINGTNPICVPATCAPGTVLIGVGTASPSCVNYNMACPVGQTMKGINAADGSPVCAITVTPGPTGSCTAPQVLQGYDSNGYPNCVNPSPTASCPAGQVLQGYNTDGSLNCVAMAAGGGGVLSWSSGIITSPNSAQAPYQHPSNNSYIVKSCSIAYDQGAAGGSCQTTDWGTLTAVGYGNDVKQCAMTCVYSK